MNVLKCTTTAVLVFLSFSSFAQDGELLSEIPQTKEEFVASEKKVLATIDWLENTPFKAEKAKHKEQYALLLAWLTNSPTVTIEMHGDILTFTKKNSELLMFFMAGWTKYALNNDYSKDTVQGNLAGIRSAIHIYKAGGLKKDKKLQKFIDMDEKGELEAWVTKTLSK